MTRQRFVHLAQIILASGLAGLGLWVAVSPWILGKFSEPREMMADSSGDFHNLNVAFEGLRHDAGIDSVRDVYRPEEFSRVSAWYMRKNAANNLEASVEIYSRSLRTLLMYGRGAPKQLQGSSDELDRRIAAAFDQQVVEKTERLAIADSLEDYWERPYRFFAGPWPSEFGPVLLRCYGRSSARREIPGSWVPSLGANDTAADQLTILVNGMECGIPAPDLSDTSEPNLHEWDPKVKVEVYIWSAGLNGLFDQPSYDESHSYAKPAREYYRGDVPDKYLGGGDDLNNWDIWRSFDVWYLRESDLKGQR